MPDGHPTFDFSLSCLPPSFPVPHQYIERAKRLIKAMLSRRLYNSLAKAFARYRGTPHVTAVCVNRSYLTLTDSKTSEVMGPDSPFFRISDYDCVGFDLDNTILKYNASNLVKLEYETVATFLVEEKGYDPVYLLKPIDLDFLQKGLALDYENGNVLQLAPDGTIQRASHGTKLLSNSEIEELYSKDKMSTLTQEYTQNMLNTWNGPLSEKIRSVMDYFDMPVALAFARCVDNIDADAGKTVGKYDLYNDITQGLISMFQRENFSKGTGGFFSALQKNPDMYLHRCSPSVCKWLKELKKKKKVFLVTGSNVDFVSFTAQYCLGDDWRDLFDIVVCFARKPGFFTGRRPFVSYIDGKEKDTVQPEDLQFGEIYSQGNWQDLYELFKKNTGLKHPKCVYIGDNLIQDVFAPDEYTRCHTVAVSEEMRGEGVGDDKKYMDVLTSNAWGSYFWQKGGKSSLWCDIIQRHSVVCIPSLDVLAEKPQAVSLQRFKCTSLDNSLPHGFYPKPPIKA